MNMALNHRPCRWVTVVVIGGGQAGLATSRELSTRGIDHVVLERGEVANSWRTERWDSLRLLTPNWQACLPGMAYQGDDPHGYMSAGELVQFFDRYARDSDAPLYTGTRVNRVLASGRGYRVQTDEVDWCCFSVVLATGP